MASPVAKLSSSSFRPPRVEEKEHKGPDWDPAISCQMPGCNHPIPDPVLLSCNHYGKKAVYNKVCLLRALINKITTHRGREIYCPSCQREIVALKLTDYRTHPLLVKIDTFNRDDKSVKWRERFSDALQKMEAEKNDHYVSVRSLITPTPLVFRDGAPLQIDLESVRRRAENICSRFISKNSPEEVLDFLFDAKVVNEELVITCVHKNHQFSLTLNRWNRLTLELISSSSWDKYLEWVQKHSLPSLKTTIKAASCAMIYGGISYLALSSLGLARVPGAYVVPIAAGCAIFKAYPWIKKCVTRIFV